MSSASSDAFDTTIAQQTSIGVFKYSVPCLVFFSITGIVLQVPVVIAHIGIGSRPNIPVVILSLIYAYLCLSFTISAMSWTSDDLSNWWSGNGWCDLDIRAFSAASLAVLSTQCVINYNMLDILRENVKITSQVQTWRRSICEITGCLLLSIINLAVSTFTMQDRFSVVQYMGCLADVDFSLAYIITYSIWLPILGLMAFFMIFLIVFRFWRRGKSASVESISFIPYMGFAQFVRITVFSLVVSVILGPLSISLGVIGFISVGKSGGVHKLAWLHGKPETWERRTHLLLEQIPMPPHAWGPRPTLLLNTITRYINLAISWLLFLCYGTGSAAQQSYALLYSKILGKDTSKPFTKESNELGSYHTGDRSPTENTFGGSFTSNKFNEWDTGAASGNKVLHVWEEVCMDDANHEPHDIFVDDAEMNTRVPQIVSVRRTAGAVSGFFCGIKKLLVNKKSNNDLSQ